MCIYSYTTIRNIREAMKTKFNKIMLTLKAHIIESYKLLNKFYCCFIST